MGKPLCVNGLYQTSNAKSTKNSKARNIKNSIISVFLKHFCMFPELCTFCFVSFFDALLMVIFTSLFIIYTLHSSFVYVIIAI